MTDVRDNPTQTAANDTGTNPIGDFIWYELMTPDPVGSKAFYDAVVGWDVSGATLGDATPFLVMVGQLGKRIISADGKKVEFDGAEGERALHTLVDFYNRDRVDSATRAAFPSGATTIFSQ